MVALPAPEGPVSRVPPCTVAKPPLALEPWLRRLVSTLTEACGAWTGGGGGGGGGEDFGLLLHMVVYLVGLA